ncbi:MAG: SDR family NAD(P)-dependent oxidoreductase [Lysobacterales bacterium]
MNDTITQLFNLSGRTAVVTGAGRGIGRAIALLLDQAGASVRAVARTQSDLDEINTVSRGRVEGWLQDVTQPEFIAELDQMSSLDILINNAGTNRPQPFVEVDAETLDDVMTLNVSAMFKTAQAATRVMMKTSGGGSIINMSSQMGHIGSPNRSVYCMTKHAVEGLTKAMAVELAEHKIRVNAVAPTFIETPLTRPMLADPEFQTFVNRMIPLGKVGQPNDVAAAALYLASDASAMVTGHSLRVDGGWTAA